LAWTVEYGPRVEKDLKAIDLAVQREILDYMDTRIAADEDPRRFGKPLRYELWRYRVRDYRLFATFGNKPVWCSF
jgi:mRNA interferase RelE/StbE